MKQTYQVDEKLGKEIHAWLGAMKVETPVNYDDDFFAAAPHLKERTIANNFRGIIETLGMNLSDDSIRGTADRVAKMYVHELFSGLDYRNFPKCTTVENKFHYDEMVLVKDIGCVSLCEHHFVAMDMRVHVAYVPHQKVLGLSKVNRIVKFFSKRPQIQERFTEQIYFALMHILNTENIGVVVNGKHYCVVQRGIEDVNSITTTSKLGGGFKSNPALRAEFMALIK